MTTHVFIVGSTTFKFHLEYLFAGTGAREHYIDFNNQSLSALHSSVENMLAKMIADASRIRKDDLIIFYLQQSFKEKIGEGKFYGIFKAKENWSFLDNNTSNQFLKDELEKSLTFRTLIEPYEVYSEGVTEWEALDEIKGIQSPNQMLWSLIYRKLKGNRGNTMITIYESERLCQLIRQKGEALDCKNKTLSFDIENQNIICLGTPPNVYSGGTEEINLLPRLICKLEENKAFESHLQAYIVKNIGQSISEPLDESVLGESKIEWLGNEVSCGVGMQRIDIMLSVIDSGGRVCIPIELKAVEASESNIIQIQRYIDWINQYYTPHEPHKSSAIQPILLARKTDNKNSPKYAKIIEKFLSFNERNVGICRNLKYIEFSLVNGTLLFTEVKYGAEN